jgi:hypothetical protein
MKHTFSLAAVVVLLVGAIQSHGQSATFDFQDGTDQGFGTGFGNDASQSFSIVDIGGSLRMFAPRTGFQVAGNERGNDGSAFYNAMAAAAANEAGYTISYDWYVDTSGWGANAGTFFQLGTYVNTGSGYYAQHFGAVEVELSGAQVASGQVFSGHVSINMAAAGYDMPAADTFFRLGLIENGDGSAQGAYFDNVSVSPVPEPTSLALVGLTAPALWMMLRRRSTQR